MYRTFLQANVIGTKIENLTFQHGCYYLKKLDGEQPKVLRNMAEKADWLA
ncbi:hypothetical protein SAMN05216319_1885 [Duganella sp. CF402]|jgi:hypothetical protein|nr:hypothetical protein EV582_1741 [Duganella sp. BK701]SEL47555.1 hypothetical protein SAMN05216319_1885 [Duganella sp. CF402]